MHGFVRERYFALLFRFIVNYEIELVHKLQDIFLIFTSIHMDRTTVSNVRCILQFDFEKNLQTFSNFGHNYIEYKKNRSNC